jgi:hypothetical protein
MAQPTTITFTYLSGYTAGSGAPASTSTATINIPNLSAGSVGGVAQPVVPQEVSIFMKQIFAAGGFWFTNSSGVQQFVPWGEIVSATAQ